MSFGLRWSASRIHRVCRHRMGLANPLRFLRELAFGHSGLREAITRLERPLAFSCDSGVRGSAR